ncbi:MAG TPA: type 1 glutamine amidotransferase [Arenibacter sp.]|nr:type 1 glutamine amidotransferase [Arenibacter sp.]
MRLLIVEGNNEETRVQRDGFGIRPYHLVFQELLAELVPKAETTVVFPADGTVGLPSVEQLKQYDGVLWTGSSLNIYDSLPDVHRQLNFAQDVFISGVPFYGSCWGMQVATVVAGGEVALSGNGLEFGISKPIELTELGRQSPFLSHRKNPYSVLCIHFDEVIKAPENSQILAGNQHSEVQAMTIDHKNGSFFGVQYHPEFSTADMALIASFFSDRLIDNNIFNSPAEVQEFCMLLKAQKGIPQEIANYQLHSQEIMAWLKYGLRFKV